MFVCVDKVSLLIRAFFKVGGLETNIRYHISMSTNCFEANCETNCNVCHLVIAYIFCHINHVIISFFCFKT